MGPDMIVVGNFEIPTELAQELSDLLTRQMIRERLLSQNMNDPVKFEEIENKLIPITNKIEVIKRQITEKHVPQQFQFPEYMWNYDGYDIAGCTCVVYKSAN